MANAPLVEAGRSVTRPEVDASSVLLATVTQPKPRISADRELRRARRMLSRVIAADWSALDLRTLSAVVYSAVDLAELIEVTLSRRGRR